MGWLGSYWTDFCEIWYLNFFKIFWENSCVTRIMGTLLGDVCTFMIISYSILLRLRNVWDRICRGNQNTHWWSVTSFWNFAVYEIMWKNAVDPDRSQINNNMAHALCILNNWGYRHPLRICSAYCFSTATMVMWIHLIIALYINCLSCVLWHRVSCLPRRWRQYVHLKHW